MVLEVARGLARIHRCSLGLRTSRLKDAVTQYRVAEGAALTMRIKFGANGLNRSFQREADAAGHLARADAVATRAEEP